jgi:hypothetical protein
VVDPEEFPPLDSRSVVFDVNRETRRTVVDILRGSEPSTVLGVLVSTPEGLTMRGIASALDEPVGVVEWNVERLEDEDLCVTVSIDGEVRVLPLAGYTVRNA